MHVRPVRLEKPAVIGVGKCEVCDGYGWYWMPGRAGPVRVICDDCESSGRQKKGKAAA